MKVIIDGGPEEIAALVLDIQERQEQSVKAPKRYAYDLIIEDDKVPDVKDIISACTNGYIF